MDQNPWFGWLIIVVLLWTLPWKALALWRSARRGEKVWFIIFVVFNTVGILEIIYLLTFGREKTSLAKSDMTKDDLPLPAENGPTNKQDIFRRMV